MTAPASPPFPELIAELRRLDEEATPAPWEWWETAPWNKPTSCGFDRRSGYPDGRFYFSTGPRVPDKEAAQRDSRLFVAVRNALPRLLLAAVRAEGLATAMRCCPGCRSMFGIREAHRCPTHSFSGAEGLARALEYALSEEGGFACPAETEDRLRAALAAYRGSAGGAKP